MEKLALTENKYAKKWYFSFWLTCTNKTYCPRLNLAVFGIKISKNELKIEEFKKRALDLRKISKEKLSEGTLTPFDKSDVIY